MKQHINITSVCIFKSLKYAACLELVRQFNSATGFELTPIGNFVVEERHDAKTNPHFLVGLRVVGSHLVPPTCEHVSSYLWETTTIT